MTRSPSRCQAVKARVRAWVLLPLAVTPVSAETLTDTASTTLAPLEIYGDPVYLERYPGATSLVPNEEVEQRRPARTTELLDSASGVNVSEEDALGRRGNIGIRGLNPRRSRKVHLMEDGSPLQLGAYGDPTTHYITNPRLVERVEVVKGSGSIVYGPQTIGGAVNFVTVMPPRDPRVLVRGAGGSEGYREGHVSMGGTWGDTGMRLDYIDQQSNGTLKDTDQTVRELFYKQVSELGDDQRLTVKLTALDEVLNQGEAGLTEVDYALNPRTNRLRDDVFEVERYAAQLSHEWRLNPDVEFTTHLYGNYIKRTAYRQAGDSSGLSNCPLGVDSGDFANVSECGNRIRPRSYTTVGIEPRMLVFHELGGVNHDLMAGLRLHQERGEREDFWGSSPNARFRECTRLNGEEDCRRQKWEADAASLFVQNTSYVGNFAITPGVRVEHWSFETLSQRSGRDDEAADRSFTEVLPGLGVSWTGLDGWTLFGGVHRGLSPPPLPEVGEQPDPEFSLNWELGVRTRGQAGVQAELSVFRVDYNDLIASDTDIVARERVNVGKARMHGLELAGRLDSQPLLGTELNYFLTGAVTWLNTEFMRSAVVGDDVVEAGNEFPYAPEWRAYLAAGVETGPFSGRVGVRYVDKQFSDNANSTVLTDGSTGVVPSYTVWEASVTYRARPDLELFAVGRNLTDRNYIASRAGGIQPGMPRQVYAGLEYQF
jgi:Fe(3+) dicitrate transport protein